MTTRPCVIALFGCLLVSSQAAGQRGAENGEWRSYGGDLGSTKYSPLDQVDASNFSSLQIEWRTPTPDARLDLEAIQRQLRERALPTAGQVPGGGGSAYGVTARYFNATPLMVDGVLYVSTPLYQAAAIDAGTGDVLWVHNPESYLSGPPPHRFNARGVAYWTDGQEARIFWGTNDGYLLSVDAATGEPASEFGDNGRVDLMEGVPRAERGTYNYLGRNWLGVVSPPIVARKRGRDTDRYLRLHDPEGGAARVDQGCRRTNWRVAMDVSHRT